MPSSPLSSPAERRRSARATLNCRATLLRTETKQSLGAFEVLNLATHGLLLSGEPPAPAGAALEVVLPFGTGEALLLPGRLMRRRPTRHGPTFVFTFGDLDPALATRLQARVDADVERAQTARVLVVDDSREIGDALRMQLAWLGHAAHAVTTPLEAVHVLEQPNQVEVAIVDLVLGGADGLELLAYLAEQHPHVRRVLMSGHAPPGQLGGPFGIAPPRALPHEVLGKPWSETTLARAVG